MSQEVFQNNAVAMSLFMGMIKLPDFQDNRK